MEWEKIENGWELKAYYGTTSICTITKDKDGDWELKSQWREEFIGNLTDDEAKAEAIEIMVSSLEGEKDYFNELIAGMQEMDKEETV